MTPNSTRERLADTRNQLRSARDEQADAREAYNRSRQAFLDAGNPGQDSPEFQATAAAQARLNQANHKVELLRESERDMLRLLAGNVTPSSYSFLQDPDTTEQLARMAGSSAPVGRVQLGQYMSSEQVADLFGGALRGEPTFMQKLNAEMFAAGITDNAPSLREGANRGIVPQLRVPLRFLDFFPSVTADQGSSHDYVVESGTYAGAAPTAEEAVKPQLTAQYDDATTQYETIAGWVKIAKQKLADSADLEARLRSRGIYSVMAALEGQVLSGDGLGNNLTGLLSTSGIGSQTYTAGDLIPDQLLRGAGVVMASGGMPNVAALSITDLISLFTLKATGGSEEYLAASALALLGQLGITIVWAPLLAAGTAVVADTRLAGRIIVREGAHVVISDADSDDLVRNRVTVLSEGRFGFEVTQPSAVCEVDLA